jgi:hypothetical protein
MLFGGYIMERTDSVQEFAGGLIAHGLNPGGAKITIHLGEVRAAVRWNAAKWPGYYLIVGKALTKNAMSQHPLLFMSEGEANHPQDLYRKLTDDVIRLRASVIYADPGSDTTIANSGQFTDLWDYLQGHKIKISLTPAPSSEDTEYGVVLMREHLKNKTLVFPVLRMTTLFRQIKDMQIKSTTVDWNEDQFYAFHALRYLLAGFAKFPESELVDSTPRARVSGLGWT